MHFKFTLPKTYQNYGLLFTIILSLLILFPGCKGDDVEEPKPAGKTCTLLTTDVIDGVYEYVYENNKLSKINDGGIIRTFFYDNSGQMTGMEFRSSSTTDTTYVHHDAQGRRVANVNYYGGELDDSTSFHYNASGDLEAIYNHYIDFPNYVHRMAVFFTYAGGKLTKMETYYDESRDGKLDLTQMDSEDEYEVYEMITGDIKNPIYMAWVYEWDLSVPLPQLFCNTMIESVTVKGNFWGDYTFSYTHQTNESGYPASSAGSDSDGESWFDTYTYRCE